MSKIKVTILENQLLAFVMANNNSNSNVLNKTCFIQLVTGLVFSLFHSWLGHMYYQTVAFSYSIQKHIQNEIRVQSVY